MLPSRPQWAVDDALWAQVDKGVKHQLFDSIQRLKVWLCMAHNYATKKQRRKWGSAGGKIGGYRRLLATTPERRKEIARLGAAARWGKVK